MASLATNADGRARQELAFVIVAVVGAMLVGVLAGVSIMGALALMVLGLGLLFAQVAWSYSRLAFVAVVVSLAVAPVYMVPNLQAFSPEPTAVLAAVVAGIVLVRHRIPAKLTAIDWLFVATCSAMVLAALVGPPRIFSTLSMLFLWVPAYVVGRAIVVREFGSQTFVLAVAAMGVVTVPFIALEWATGENPFLSLATGRSEFTALWGREDVRLGGHPRTEGAFGHPLSMALVVSSAAVFCVAMAVKTRGIRRVSWCALTACLAVAQATTDERSGWVVLAVGLCLFAATAIPPRKRLRHGFTIITLGVPIALGVYQFVGKSADYSGSTAAARADSTKYRQELYAHAFDPGAIPPFGNVVTRTSNPFADAVRPGFNSVDSAYLQFGSEYGLIALLGFLGIVGATVVVAFRARGTWQAVIPAVVIADFVGLLVIGFQTQMTVFVWLMVGATSGVVGARSAVSSAPAREHLEPSALREADELVADTAIARQQRR